MRYRLLVTTVLCLVFLLKSQVGGGHVFEFVNLPTSPRINALGGYISSVIDEDLNNGMYNPALINPLMHNRIALNYTNYYADIIYGDVGYSFGLREYNIVSSIKFIDYGNFVETDSYGNELGVFSAGEYLFSLGVGKVIDSLFCVGVNTKMAYSSLYEIQSLALMLDFGLTYTHPDHDLNASIIIKNLGYHLIPYYQGNRENLPFEILLGFSNKLAHMPLRWHLTIQHLETPDLGVDNNLSSIYIDNNSLFNDIFKHFIFGAEFLIHKNVNILIGYNNRRRSEMIIEDRKALVGFSTGIVFKINRFHFNYSRTSQHFSGPINTFGIITSLKKW